MINQVLALVVFAAPAPAAKPAAEETPQQVAEKYLAALSDPKKAQSKDALLLGGLSLDAKAATVIGPKIVQKAEPRKEEGQVADLFAAVDALDKAGLELLGDSASIGGAGVAQHDVNIDHARKMAEKTKQLRKDLITKYPVFSDVIRADKMLYWHPKNPARLLLQKAERTGPYKVEYASFTVESKDSAKDKARQWPLRVVRVTFGTTDSGWKVLPASSWDPE